MSRRILDIRAVFQPMPKCITDTRFSLFLFHKSPFSLGYADSLSRELPEVNETFLWSNKNDIMIFIAERHKMISDSVDDIVSTDLHGVLAN